MTREIVIDKDFIKNVPSTGSVEFDYVSTTRPVFYSKNKLQESFSLGHGGAHSPAHHHSGAHSPAPHHAGAPSPSHHHGGSLPLTHSGLNILLPPTNDDELLTDDEFYVFMEKVGLSSRVKITSANALFVLMDLQLASTKYYFTVDQVHSILDSFADEWDVQAKVVVAMFSRIKDLHRMDMILRHLDSKAQQEIVSRLGPLNLLNPLKISFDYVLPFKYLDNRIMFVMLMELASIESADQITEDPSSELPIATYYGAFTRAQNETRPEVMKISFADFGERSKNVSWSDRRNIIKKFLIGTQPIDDTMYQVITQYRELEAAGALTSGPIDLQYGSFLKSSKVSAIKSVKSNKVMSAMMRTAAAMAKKEK